MSLQGGLFGVGVSLKRYILSETLAHYIVEYIHVRYLLDQGNALKKTDVKCFFRIRAHPKSALTVVFVGSVWISNHVL